MRWTATAASDLPPDLLWAQVLPAIPARWYRRDFVAETDRVALYSRRRRPLEFSAGDLFGNGANFSDATFWSGLRPMTPDSPPIIGATRLDGLYLNTGHGTLGWTMSCGSGRVIADIISGRKPEIDTNGLGIEPAVAHRAVVEQVVSARAYRMDKAVDQLLL